MVSVWVARLTCWFSLCNCMHMLKYNIYILILIIFFLLDLFSRRIGKVTPKQMNKILFVGDLGKLQKDDGVNPYKFGCPFCLLRLSTKYGNYSAQRQQQWILEWIQWIILCRFTIVKRNWKNMFMLASIHRRVRSICH